MTTKLYLDDPWTTEFRARLVATGEAKGKPFAVLESTFFYAECGGQLADRGWLGEARVTDVQEVDGQLRHLLDRPLASAPGESLPARVERAVREDHMHQHTGQHLLSAAFLEVLGSPTVSFHMGEEASTIDLDREDLTWEDLTRVEERVNAVIREDRPIAVLYPDEAELAGMLLRKEPVVTARVRVIAVEGFDMSPCGGTHCSRTGQLGAIHVRRWERVRQKVRVHFLAGRRGVVDHQQKSRLALALSGALSVKDGEIEGRVSDLMARQKELSRELDLLRETLWGHQAAALTAGARWLGRHRLVTAPVDSAAHAKALALAVCAAPDVVACLWTAAGDAALGAGAETGVNAGQLFRELVAARGGKGGGQAGLAQGRLSPEAATGLAGDVAAWLARLAGDPAALGRVAREHVARDGTPFRVREALPSDAEAMVGFHAELLRSKPLILWEDGEPIFTAEKRQAQLVAAQGRENEITLVAEHAGRLVGQVSFRSGERRRVRHAGELGISVAADWQGRGVGRALMQDLLDWCRERGVVRKISLGVVAGNEAALALYRSLGFAEEGRVRRGIRIDGRFEDEIKMGLWIGSEPEVDSP